MGKDDPDFDLDKSLVAPGFFITCRSFYYLIKVKIPEAGRKLLKSMITLTVNCENGDSLKSVAKFLIATL